MADNPPPALDLAAIEARVAKATPGPWTAVPQEQKVHSEFVVPSPLRPAAVVDAESHSFWECCYRQGSGQPFRDAMFIAHARTDVPALIAEVRRLEGALEDRTQERNWEAQYAAGYKANTDEWCERALQAEKELAELREALQKAGRVRGE